jgi:hypothetical protein
MRRLCPFEIFASVFIVAFLAALLLPTIHSRGCLDGCRGGDCGLQVRCGFNLTDLYQLGTVYAASPRGQWPEVQNGNCWLFLTKTTPPLIEAEHREILRCPVLEHSERDCDYRGPMVPWSSLRPDDPIAADRRGNHAEHKSINVLLKDGCVLEVEIDDPRWKRWNELLGP